MRGMSSTSPCSKSILSAISPIRLSSRWRAKMTGRWPSLTNLRLVSAPMTPIPPVIRTFMLLSIDSCADGVDQSTPVLRDQLQAVWSPRGEFSTSGSSTQRCLQEINKIGRLRRQGFYFCVVGAHSFRRKRNAFEDDIELLVGNFGLNGMER